jgi:hypothetical protein
MPRVFEIYLGSEQNSLQTEVYRTKLEQIQATRTALLQAGDDLVNSTVLDVTSPITLTKEYVELSSRITTLQDELNNQAALAANLLAQGVTPAGAEASATALDSVSSVNEYETDPYVLQARIKGLEEALTTQEWVAAGFTLALGSSSSSLPGIPTISKSLQTAHSQLYTNTISAMERTSTELSTTKVEMDKLLAEIVQEKLKRTRKMPPKGWLITWPWTS